MTLKQQSIAFTDARRQQLINPITMNEVVSRNDGDSGSSVTQLAGEESAPAGASEDTFPGPFRTAQILQITPKRTIKAFTAFKEGVCKKIRISNVHYWRYGDFK